MRRMIWQYQGGATEIRDGVDAGWWNFMGSALPGSAFMPLPNIGKGIAKILNSSAFSGFILTGGDDWGVFPDRDLTETIIFDYAQSHSLPIIGVCRGAQVINMLLGGINSPVRGHAGTRHPVYLNDHKTRLVNSYHNYGLDKIGNGLCPTARDANGFIEAYSTADGGIQGIMWHPEREITPDQDDLKMFNQILNVAQK